MRAISAPYNGCDGTHPVPRRRTSHTAPHANSSRTHVLYGTETFLYALHLVPQLVILASLSAKTAFRPAAVVLAVALLGLGGVNNARQWREAREFFLHHNAAGVRDSAEPTER
jgi:hypothetical protein